MAIKGENMSTSRTVSKWDERSLAALPAPTTTTAIDYMHRSIPGLVLRVTAAGGRTYYLRRRVNGKPTFVRLGTFPKMLPSAAVDAAKKVNGQIDLGSDPRRQSAPAATTGSTLAAFWTERFEPHHIDRRLKPSTAYQYRLCWERYIAKYEVVVDGAKTELGKLPLSQVTPDLVARLHEDIGATGKTRTANFVLSVLRVVLGRAIRLKVMPGPNPAGDLGDQRFTENKRDRHLSRDEIASLYRALEDHAQAGDPDLHDFVKILLLTGARRGNVLAMRWQDVDLLARRWTIPAAVTKTSTPYMVIMPPGAVAILERRRQDRQDSPYVFPAKRIGEKGTPHMGDPRNAWEAVRKVAGLEDVRLHDLRHTHASIMAADGVPLQIIGAQLGHRSIRTTERYAHLLADRIQEAVDGAMARVAEISGGE